MLACDLDEPRREHGKEEDAAERHLLLLTGHPERGEQEVERDDRERSAERPDVTTRPAA